MRQTDVAIIGGGLAGSTAAAMLGRAGIDTVLIDPRTTYPPEFRAEKLDGEQAAILARTGIADAVLAHAQHAQAIWIAHFDRLLHKKPNGTQYGILYDTLVNAARAAVPDTVAWLAAKATAVTTSAERQVVTLSTGEEVSARLVVLANGLSLSLRHTLGIERVVTDPCHSISAGFDMKPIGRASFDFPALTYYATRPADRFAYLTLFPTKSGMRANFMAYRDLSDPWVTAFRDDPVAALNEAMPGLTEITGPFEVAGTLKFRPADLYVTTGHLQAGIVLVGDAFSTSCPAAGTGTGKVFTDVERLCNVHIPAWLATPGMGRDKIAAFYADPVKIAYDTFAIGKARRLKATSVNPGLRWGARRWARFAVHALKGLREQFRAPVPTPRHVVAADAHDKHATAA